MGSQLTSFGPKILRSWREVPTALCRSKNVTLQILFLDIAPPLRRAWIECCRNIWSKVWVVNGWRIVFICSSSAIHTRALKTWPVVDPSDGCAQPQDGCALGSTAGKVWLRHSGVSVLYGFMHWRDLDSSPPIKDPLAEHHSQAVFSWWGPVQKS